MNKFKKIIPAVLFILTAVLTVKFRSIPKGKTWQDFKVLYVSKTFPQTNVEKILNEVFERIGTDVLWETVHSGTIDMEKILDRFLRYISVDTQSNEESETQPSAMKELDLLKMLCEELNALGIKAELDEWGYVPVDREGAHLLFRVIADSYEQKSLILTTNIEFSKWGSVFTDDQMTAAMIDRLVHHGQ